MCTARKPMSQLEVVLQELGVYHIPIRRKASGFVYNNPYVGLFRPVYKHVVLVGSWYHQVKSEDVSVCLRSLHIPVVYADDSTVRGQVVDALLPNGVSVGEEVVLTVAARSYVFAARRCQEVVEV